MSVKWDDLENSEYEEAILCFMAIKDSQDGGSDIRVNKSNLFTINYFTHLKKFKKTFKGYCKILTA